jgi:hypothetical protein
MTNAPPVFLSKFEERKTGSAMQRPKANIAKDAGGPTLQRQDKSYRVKKKGGAPKREQEARTASRKQAGERRTPSRHLTPRRKRQNRPRRPENAALRSVFKCIQEQGTCTDGFPFSKTETESREATQARRQSIANDTTQKAERRGQAPPIRRSTRDLES